MVKKANQIILGIDPGYDRFGWAIIYSQAGQLRLIDCGCIETDKKASRFGRYAHVQDFLTKIIEHYHPTVAGLEQLFFSRNVSTALPVAEIRGLAIAVLLRHQVEILEFNPGTVKSAVAGNGKADKAAMRKMVLIQLGNVDPAVRQRVETALDDTVDAIGVALTAAQTPTSV